MKVTTTRTSNASGTSQVLAKGHGKQKTTNWNPAKSTDWNHGNAAGALVLHLGKADPLFLTEATESLNDGSAVHNQSDDGQRHVFAL